MAMQRAQYEEITSRINEPRRFIQIIEGPRQVGKSTLIKQVLNQTSLPWLHYAADNVPASEASWISQCWAVARSKMQLEHLPQLLLVFDEIQKLRNWSEVVKKEWDADTFSDVNIKVVLLGSSRVRLEKGLSESLKGRFEVIRMANWTFSEMNEAFGLTLDEYIYYGGYPGAAPLIGNEDRFRSYIRNAIVDATISNDILIDTPIAKPALLKQTFELSAAYSSQLVSLTKMVGQLQDAGNTTTLSGYLHLLDQSGMVCGLQKFASDQARRRASVPKYQVYNNALMTLFADHDFTSARMQPKVWGRIFESAVGAHIINQAYTRAFDVYYWRDGDDEVDFVLTRHSKVVAIEVKSGDEKSTRGLRRFQEMYHPHNALIVGPQGVTPETFFSADLNDLF